MTPATSYDALPYLTRPRRATHPDTLATAATLLGMAPAPVDRCRVLELGCGTGGNLVPMAATLPGSQFVGVDLSAVQIEYATQTARDLGLSNVEFRAASVLDVDDSWGTFDYVICHGVYSWVPDEVQDGILDICTRNLASHGVAYVSYNTHPGWHLRAIARDAMLYHAREAATPPEQVAAARGYLGFLAQSVPDPEEPYARLLREEVELLREQEDYYLFHEHLERDNRPVYFHQFMERAGSRGLQYLAEVPPNRMLTGLPTEVQDTLRKISRDLVQLEQHVDFLRNRSFRRTLLCKADLPLNRGPAPAVLDRFLASALARPTTPDPDVRSDAAVEFVSREGTTMSTNSPVIKTALVHLYRSWPKPVGVPALAAAVAEQLGPVWAADPDHRRRALSQTLLDFYLTGLVELHTHMPEFTTRPTKRPLGFAVARHQAADRELLACVRHQEVPTTPCDRFVLRLADGTRDRAALANSVAAAVRRGELPPPDGPPESWVDAALARLGQSALLVG